MALVLAHTTTAKATEEQADGSVVFSRAEMEQLKDRITECKTLAIRETACQTSLAHLEGTAAPGKPFWREPAFALPVALVGGAGLGWALARTDRLPVASACGLVAALTALSFTVEF